MKFGKILKLTALIVTVFFISACASPARIDSMIAPTPPQYDPSSSFLRTAIIVEQVSGGRDTNPMWTSQVDSNSFKVALERSLLQAGLLSRGQLDGYLLRADLQELDQPLMGISMTVTATVRYRLVSTENNSVIYDRVIERPYTARAGDAFMGAERLKLASEGAIRVNIEELIKDLYALPK